VRLPCFSRYFQRNDILHAGVVEQAGQCGAARLLFPAPVDDIFSTFGRERGMIGFFLD
jgi:hypothetical protein